ncbi:MAG TPA: ABC transporter permease subunit [Gemmataceae bacterium]|nr:ABC transporter permease subunit [Gemmataceae bacterium]
MKYLAILQDSFREAIDSRVFPVMLLFSGLLMLALATLSFEPRPVDEFSETLQVWLNNRMATQGAARLSSPALFQIKGVDPWQGAPDRPDSMFCFLLRMQFQKPQDAARAREALGPVQELVRQHFGMIDDWRVLEVTEVRPAQVGNPHLPPAPEANAVFLEVVTRPTDKTLRLWPHRSTVLFGSVPLSSAWTVLDLKIEPALGCQVWMIEDYLVGGLGAWVAILVSVVLTAFFIPNMLGKGSVDLLLAKPIYRPTLLVYKYIGGLTFIFLNSAVAIAGAWLVIGWRSGIWAPGFLLTTFVITFFFAILYSVSTLVAVWTRSTVLAIVLTCVVWAALFGVGWTQLYVEGKRMETKPAPTKSGASTPVEPWMAVVSGVHFVLPRTKDLDYLTTRLLVQDLLPPNEVRAIPQSSATFNWTETLTVSGVFIAVMLALASWRFVTRDY